MLIFNLLAVPAQHSITPFIDIYELADRVIVLADMPGVEKEGMELRAEGSQLQLRGRCASRDDGYALMRECPRYDYYRLLNLSDAIEIEAIDAQLRDGVLMLTLPKRASARAAGVSITAE